MFNLEKTHTDEHFVQFYETDGYLVEKVSDFIAEGLSAGELAIVIATREHLDALAEALKHKLGEHLGGSFKKHDHCMMLDAEQVLSSFMIEGWPDERRFNDVIGNVLTQAQAGSNKPVRAFGEMVALLCGQGKPEAAIHLEGLWNKLAKHHAFSLLCGYPMTAFSREESSQSFHAICTLHSRVCPAEHRHASGSPGDGALTLARLQQKTHALESEVERRKRTEQVLYEREAALLDTNGQLRLEIEKRRATEKELLHAYHVQTVAQRVAGLGIWEIDTGTGAMQCSDEFFRIFGLEPQSVQLTLGSALSFIHPDDQKSFSQTIVATRETLQTYRKEHRIVQPNGSIRHVISQGQTVVDEQRRLTGVIGSLLDITKHKQAEQALRQSHDNLRRLAAHQEKIKEEERKRIAREVHDELGGLLTGLKAIVERSMEQTAKAGMPCEKLLHQARVLTDSAIESVRRIVTDLRPSVLDQLGIWAALEWYVEQLAERTHLVCTCTISETAAAATLDEERSTMLFRIVQEALTNVVRHAQASRARVDVVHEDGFIMVEIADDGKGIDTNRLLDRQSWGISGMYERVHQIGGELKFSGTPGKGTLVLLRFPLKSSHGH